MMVAPMGAASTVNGIIAVDVDSGGVALSKAVACAVWLPTASVVVLKLYGELVSVLTSVPSTRNSTRLTPLLSLALAASGTARALVELLAAGRAGQTHGGRRVLRWLRRAAIAGRAIQRERRGRVVSAAERAVEPDGEALAAADALVPLRIARDRHLRAAGRMGERHRPAILQALTVREAEDQRPAVGDGGTVVGDDDVGAEAITAFPALGVSDLAGGRLRLRPWSNVSASRQTADAVHARRASKRSHVNLLSLKIGGASRSPRRAPPVISLHASRSSGNVPVCVYCVPPTGVVHRPRVARHRMRGAVAADLRREGAHCRCTQLLTGVQRPGVDDRRRRARHALRDLPAHGVVLAAVS